MKPVRRLFISIGAPLILLLGLGAIWGVRQGSAMIKQIEEWGHAWEHSEHPVQMHVSGVPIVSTMYVDGDKIGKFDEIVIMRHAPGEVDSLRVMVDVKDDQALARLSECQLQVDPEALEHSFPLEGWKHVISCASDTDGLVRFGTVHFTGLDASTPLLLHRSHLPCDVMGDSDVCMDIDELREDMHRLRDEIRRDVRRSINIRINR